MLYRILKLLIGVGMRLYYREIRVKGATHLEHDGPMIIIANHPNTLMDAWLIAIASKKPIHYLAKGTFFNTKFKRWILGNLGMIPINRLEDGNTSGVSNLSSFDACYKILETGKTLVVFPEGNSVMERQLRELKSGTARIALEVSKRNKGTAKLLIVPVGLFYSQANRFRSSVFMQIGKGIPVREYLEQYKENPSQTARIVTEKFRVLLEDVLVLSASKEQETLVDDLCGIFCLEGEPSDIEVRANALGNLHKRLEEIQLLEPYKMEEIQRLINSFKWQAKQVELRTEFMERGIRSKSFVMELLLSLVYFLVGFPLFLFGFIHSIIPYKLTELLMPKLVKNIEYYAPIAILLGLVLYPLNYIFLVSVATRAFGLSPMVEIIYFLLMPFTGMFAFHFARFLGIISFRVRFTFFLAKKKQTFESMKEIRDSLRYLIFGTDAVKEMITK